MLAGPDVGGYVSVTHTKSVLCDGTSSIVGAFVGTEHEHTRARCSAVSCVKTQCRVFSSGDRNQLTPAGFIAALV